MYITQHVAKTAGNVSGKFVFPLQFLVHLFHILHYNGVSAVLRGGPAWQLLRVSTYECRDITGLIGKEVLGNSS